MQTYIIETFSAQQLESKQPRKENNITYSKKIEKYVRAKEK